MIRPEKEKREAGGQHLSGKGANMIQIVLCDDNVQFMEKFRSATRNILDHHNIEAAIHTFDCSENIPDYLWNTCDIFFLDIDFSGKRYTGIDIARRIRVVNNDAVIVFVTSYLEYAPEGYEVQAFRYLLKEDISPKLSACILDSIAKLKSNRESLEISISGESVVILLADIVFIESQRHVAVIHICNAAGVRKAYRYYASLASLEQELSPKGFLRVQKSYLVNMRRIQQYHCKGVILDTGETLRVSIQSYAEQKKRYLLWKGKR